MRKNHSMPMAMDFSYMRYEHMRVTRSHDHLPSNERPGMFNRSSSLADLAYVALPGLTSRVTRNRSAVSLTNLSDVFNDHPEVESPVYIEATASRSLVMTVFVALISTFLYGYNNGNMNTPANAMRASLGIPATALTPEGLAVAIPSNDTLWGFVVSIFSLGALLGCNSSSQVRARLRLVYATLALTPHLSRPELAPSPISTARARAGSCHAAHGTGGMPRPARHVPRASHARRPVPMRPALPWPVRSSPTGGGARRSSYGTR